MDLHNYIWYDFVAPPGLSIQYSGQTATSSSAEFVVQGGSGSGQLMGTVWVDYAAWHWGRGPAGASEVYDSNFVWPRGVHGRQLLVFPFTFGVPFTLRLADDIKFFGLSSISI